MTEDRDAVDRAAYEETDNPLHVWFAIGRYAVNEPLPDWIRRYLMQCARELLRLELDNTISPTEAVERAPRAFGLVVGKRGHNAFAAARRFKEHSVMATLYDHGAATAAEFTVGSGDGEESQRGPWEMKDERSVRKVITKFRKIWCQGARR